MTPKQVTKNKRLIKKILNHFNCVLCGISANVLILKGICNRCGILGCLGERLKQCLVRIFCRNRFGIFAQNALNRLAVQIKFFAIAREPLCSARLINIILFLSTPFSIAVSFGGCPSRYLYEISGFFNAQRWKRVFKYLDDALYRFLMDQRDEFTSKKGIPQEKPIANIMEAYIDGNHMLHLMLEEAMKACPQA